MAAFRPRRVFAASFVITVAACSKTANEPDPAGSGSQSNPPGRPFTEQWNVWKNSGVCEASNFECAPGVSCNPPPPRPITCPEGITESAPMRVGTYSDGTCAVVATQMETRCPWTWKELSEMNRTGQMLDDGHCVASWQPPLNSPPKFVMACPATEIKTFTISREDVDKPCFASGPAMQAKVEVPCPVEPKLFLSGQLFKKDYQANPTAFDGKRVQIQGFYLAAHSSGNKVGVAGTAYDDKLAVTCTSKAAPMAMKPKDWIVLDGVVKASPPGDVALEDCAIWPH
jgi:hypothetical protein